PGVETLSRLGGVGGPAGGRPKEEVTAARRPLSRRTTLDEEDGFLGRVQALLEGDVQCANEEEVTAPEADVDGGDLRVIGQSGRQEGEGLETRAQACRRREAGPREELDEEVRGGWQVSYLGSRPIRDAAEVG